MTQEEILEGNTLIEIFRDRFEPLKDVNGFIYAFRGEYGMFNYTDLLYHISWDWLMPVVEKIESDLAKVKVFKIAYDSRAKQIGHECYSCEILPAVENAFNTMFYTSNDKIEAVWFVVLKYIKWYNEQSK